MVEDKELLRREYWVVHDRCTSPQEHHKRQPSDDLHCLANTIAVDEIRLGDIRTPAIQKCPESPPYVRLFAAADQRRDQILTLISMLSKFVLKTGYLIHLVSHLNRIRYILIFPAVEDNINNTWPNGFTNSCDESQIGSHTRQTTQIRLDGLVLCVTRLHYNLLSLIAWVFRIITGHSIRGCFITDGPANQSAKQYTQDLTFYAPQSDVQRNDCHHHVTKSST